MPGGFLDYLLRLACLVLDLLGEVGEVIPSSQRHDWIQFHRQNLLIYYPCRVTLILSLGSSLTLGVMYRLLLWLVTVIRLLLVRFTIF